MNLIKLFNLERRIKDTYAVLTCFLCMHRRLLEQLSACCYIDQTPTTVSITGLTTRDYTRTCPTCGRPQKLQIATKDRLKISPQNGFDPNFKL